MFLENILLGSGWFPPNNYLRIFMVAQSWLVCADFLGILAVFRLFREEVALFGYTLHWRLFLIMNPLAIKGNK